MIGSQGVHDRAQSGGLARTRITVHDENIPVVTRQKFGNPAEKAVLTGRRLEFERLDESIVKESGRKPQRLIVEQKGSDGRIIRNL